MGSLSGFFSIVTDSVALKPTKLKTDIIYCPTSVCLECIVGNISKKAPKALIPLVGIVSVSS